jgi:capsular exopolysaccharide synthesis family protein
VRSRARADDGATGEAFRVLRTSLTLCLADLDRPTVLVTSARAGEGKTDTTARLASSFAEAGRRAVVVDLDLRKPGVHEVFGLDNDRGVSDVLLDELALADCLQFVKLRGPGSAPGRGLYALTSGPSVPNPTELLDTRRTSKLLDGLAEQADIVLVDAPPVLPVADTLVIGKTVGGAILVLEAGRTPIGEIEQAKDALIRAQTRLLGVVVNRADGRAAEYGYGPVPGPDAGS